MLLAPFISHHIAQLVVEKLQQQNHLPQQALALSDNSESCRLWHSAYPNSQWHSALHFTELESLPKTSFDTVIAAHVLEYETQWQQRLQQLSQLLSDKGLFLACCLGSKSWHSLHELGLQPAPFVYQDIHQLGDCLLRQGFERVVVDKTTVDIGYDDLNLLQQDLVLSELTQHALDPVQCQSLLKQWPQHIKHVVLNHELLIVSGIKSSPIQPKAQGIVWK